MKRPIPVVQGDFSRVTPRDAVLGGGGKERLTTVIRTHGSEMLFKAECRRAATSVADGATK